MHNLLPQLFTMLAALLSKIILQFVACLVARGIIPVLLFWFGLFFIFCSVDLSLAGLPTCGNLCTHLFLSVALRAYFTDPLKNILFSLSLIIFQFPVQASRGLQQKTRSLCFGNLEQMAIQISWLSSVLGLWGVHTASSPVVRSHNHLAYPLTPLLFFYFFFAQ